MDRYFEDLRTKQNPTIGEIKAYRVYKNNFILEDFLWEKEVKDFVNTLREGGGLNISCIHQLALP